MAARNDLRFAWLEAFLKLAELGSYGKAAKACGHDATTCSRNVFYLERWLGRVLVTGSTRVTLTADGEAFRATAQHVLDALNEHRVGERPALRPPRVSGADIEIS